MKKSATITVDIQFVQDDGVTPVNITGATSRFMIKRLVSDLDAAALIDKVPTTNVTDEPLGKCSTNITATEANNLPNNVPLFCEAMAVFPGGEVVRTETQGFTLVNNLIKAIS